MNGVRLKHGMSEFTCRGLEDLFRRNFAVLEERNKKFDNLETKHLKK